MNFHPQLRFALDNCYWQDFVSSTTRRQTLLGAAAGALMLLEASQARAFLGFGEPSQEEIYKEDTVRIQP